MTGPFDANLRSFMRESVVVHASAGACLVEEIDCDLLDDAGADAAEHMLAGVPLDDDIVDPLVMQELAEQKAGRAGADNDNLCPHGSPFGMTLHGTMTNDGNNSGFRLDLGQRSGLFGKGTGRAKETKCRLLKISAHRRGIL